MKGMKWVPALFPWMACAVLMSAPLAVQAAPVRATWDIEFGVPGWAGTFTVSNAATLAYPDEHIDASITINTPYGKFSSGGGAVGAGATDGRCAFLAHEAGIDAPPYPWGVCTPNLLWGSITRPSDGLSLQISTAWVSLFAPGQSLPVEAPLGYSIHRRSPDLATFPV